MRLSSTNQTTDFFQRSIKWYTIFDKSAEAAESICESKWKLVGRRSEQEEGLGETGYPSDPRAEVAMEHGFDLYIGGNGKNGHFR